MLYAITKAILSGAIILAASEVAKRSPTYGSLILSLPFISILAFIWLWRDTGDNDRIAALSEGTFWLVLADAPHVPRLARAPANRCGVRDSASNFLCNDYGALCDRGVAASEGRDQFLILHPSQCPLWVISGHRVTGPRHVRFTPESGHSSASVARPLSAISRRPVPPTMLPSSLALRAPLREGLSAPRHYIRGPGATQRSFNGPIGNRGHEVKCWRRFQHHRLELATHAALL